MLLLPMMGMGKCRITFFNVAVENLMRLGGTVERKFGVILRYDSERKL